jgi:hypothetical protein
MSVCRCNKSPDDLTRRLKKVRNTVTWGMRTDRLATNDGTYRHRLTFILPYARVPTSEMKTGLSASQIVAEGVGITVVDRLWRDAMPPGRVEFRPWTVRYSFDLIHPAATSLRPPARL